MGTKKLSDAAKAMIETAEELHRAGIVSDATLQKITVRHLGPDVPSTGVPMSPDDIRKLREQAKLSQAALAKYLNLTTGYVSQLERGAKIAKGPALALLNVIRRKGIEAIL
jgi:putative transcriptional regulator